MSAGVSPSAGPRSCEHPAAGLIPQTRLGAASGQAVCSACGARVPYPQPAPRGVPVSGL